MTDREKLIKKLESLRDICNAKSNMAVGNGKVAWAGYANTADDVLALLKEQEAEAEPGHWVVLENCSNAGVYCSECNTKIFDHYPMKKKYSYFCPHCGTRMEGQAVKWE